MFFIKILVYKLDNFFFYFQVKLPKNFEYSDDVAIENLQRCVEELKKSKLDYAGTPPPNELPKKPFGIFKPNSSFEQKVRNCSQYLACVKFNLKAIMSCVGYSLELRFIFSRWESSIAYAEHYHMNSYLFHGLHFSFRLSVYEKISAVLKN